MVGPSAPEIRITPDTHLAEPAVPCESDEELVPVLVDVSAIEDLPPTFLDRPVHVRGPSLVRCRDLDEDVGSHPAVITFYQDVDQTVACRLLGMRVESVVAEVPDEILFAFVMLPGIAYGHTELVFIERLGGGDSVASVQGGEETILGYVPGTYLLKQTVESMHRLLRGHRYVTGNEALAGIREPGSGLQIPCHDQAR